MGEEVIQVKKNPFPLKDKEGSKNLLSCTVVDLQTEPPVRH